MKRNPCPYCAFSAEELHVLFDHLERQHILELTMTTIGEVSEPVSV